VFSLHSYEGSVLAARETAVTTVSGGTGSNSVTTSRTSYVANLRIDGKSVVIKSSRPVAIHPGDTVRVAAFDWRGTLHPFAWRNLSTGAHDARISILDLGVSSVVGLGVLGLAIDSGIPWLIALAVAAIGVIGYFAHLRSAAGRLLRTPSASPQ
jgi:hypothetical protein